MSVVQYSLRHQHHQHHLQPEEQILTSHRQSLLNRMRHAVLSIKQIASVTPLVLQWQVG
jgi:hypothetical protein